MRPLYSSSCLTSKSRDGERMSYNSAECYPWLLRNANVLSIRFIKFSEFSWKQISHCVVFCRTKLTVCPKLGNIRNIMYMWSCCHLPFKKILSLKQLKLSKCRLLFNKIFSQIFFQKLLYLLSVLLNRWTSCEISCQIY